MPGRRAFLGGAMALGANGVRANAAWERRKALEAKPRAVPQFVSI